MFSGTSKQQVSLQWPELCIHLHFLLDGNGDWNASGCILTSFNPSTDVVSCECDHLTNFACLVVSKL